MDCSRLKLSIPSYRISDDGTTHLFCNAVVYGKLKWEVPHRFSEFHTLYERLILTQLEAIQPPPPKSIGRPTNSMVLEERRFMLETWLKALAARPDIRTSAPFVDFIEFEIHTNSNVTPLAPHLEAVYQDSRFQLSDFQWVKTQRTIFAAYEESASMSRLGKVWSLVENEEAGALSILGLPKSELAAEYDSFDAMFHTNTRHRCLGLFYHEATGRIFVGLESGVVEVYRQARHPATAINTNNPQAANYPPISDTFCGLEKEEQLVLHSESVLSIRGQDCGPGRLISVGFDKAVRVVNCTTLETLCGGKLSKRLEKGQNLTMGVLEEAADEEELMKSRMFIGSSNGSVFVFSTALNPPEWLHTIENDSPNNTHPVTALELAGSSLLVARKYTMSIYRVGKPLDATLKVTRIAMYEPQLKAGRTIRSISISRTAPLLFLGHTQAISVWDVRESAATSVFNAHYNGVRRLCVLEGNDQSFPTVAPSTPYEPASRHLQLLSGGADGSIKLWRIKNVDDLTLWKQPEAANSEQPSTGAQATAAKTVEDNKTNGQSPDGHSGGDSGLGSAPLFKKSSNCSDTDDSLLISSEFTQVRSHRH